MENLRWILIFAGVAILVLLYVSGRSASPKRRDARSAADPDPLLGEGRSSRRRVGARGDHDALPEPGFDAFDAMDPDDLQRPGAPVAAPPRRVAVRRQPVHDFESVAAEDFEPVGYADPPPVVAPARGRGRPDAPAGAGSPRRVVRQRDMEPVGRGEMDPGRGHFGVHPDQREPHPHDRFQDDYAPRDFRQDSRHDARHGGGYDDDGGHGDGLGHDDGYDDGHDAAYGGARDDRAHARGDAYADELDDASAPDRGHDRGGEGGAVAALGGIGRRIESLGARLGGGFGGGRRKGEDDDEPTSGSAPAPTPATKIVTLHVVAREGGWFDGESIASAFEARGYSFGEMDIFHSMHRGDIVFSIAKMIRPGSFDPDDIDSFATPGLVLILQLPGPVPPDAAFGVLLSEAHELATGLDGRLLDGDRSTLSKQSAQHMRDGITDFMHRQKFFGGAAG